MTKPPGGWPSRYVRSQKTRGRIEHWLSIWGTFQYARLWRQRAQIGGEPVPDFAVFFMDPPPSVGSDELPRTPGCWEHCPYGCNLTASARPSLQASHRRERPLIVQVIDALFLGLRYR